jgi:dipeptidyl aminopeptidase/acylaminoacyl peptidase
MRPLSETVTARGIFSLLAFIFVLLIPTPSGPIATRRRSQVSMKEEIPRRPVTVADTIQMTQLANNRGPQFAPDGNAFVLVVRKGNLQDNRNDYSLLLFHTRESSQSVGPDLLASFSSSSNRAAIEDPRWIGNRTIAFLAEGPGENKQLYVLDVETKELQKLTNHRTSLISYTLTSDGNHIFFEAAQPINDLISESTKRNGIVVSKEMLTDLIALKNRSRATIFLDLFTEQRGSDQEVLLETHGPKVEPSLWLSPDGKYILVRTLMIDDPPRSWRQYEDDELQTEIRSKHSNGEPLLIYQYEVIDTTSGEHHILINAPMGDHHRDVGWSPDSHSVVVSGTYLPLDSRNAHDFEQRRKTTFIAEINLSSGKITPITGQRLSLRRWDSKTGRLIFGTAAEGAAGGTQGTAAVYEKTESGWKAVAAKSSDLEQSGVPEITVEENSNMPPEIFEMDKEDRQRSLLLDLNPQFRELKFGRVESVAFKATDGHLVKAGIYFPVDYAPGRRYPLVIQTHDWDPGYFWINGPYTTGSAAQPLAGLGFVVAQLDRNRSHPGTLAEVQGEAAAYEGAIDYLDRRGLIDRKLVGLVGFSRTGLGVKYALTHSSYHFAAATVADGSDVGYLRYLALLNSESWQSSDAEGINGGIPFGKGIASWLNGASGFDLERVGTPIRLEANNPESLLFCWEWFVGLSRLGKPVDLIYMPEAVHALFKPWDIMTSEQGNVDWFCFWLRGSEDPDPEKAQQYARWRGMQRLVERNAKRAGASTN